MKKKVGILYGGRSGEHEISLLSGAAVLRALDKEKYIPVPIGIDKEGAWFIADGFDVESAKDKDALVEKLAFVIEQGEWKSGRYATLSLDKPLKKKKTYEYIIRFKAKSASSKICFYLKDSNSRVAKELAAYKMPDGRATDWVTIKGSFTPSVDGLGEFMLGASQFTGEGNFITFDLIFITE